MRVSGSTSRPPASCWDRAVADARRGWSTSCATSASGHLDPAGARPAWPRRGRSRRRPCAPPAPVEFETELAGRLPSADETAPTSSTAVGKSHQRREVRREPVMPASTCAGPAPSSWSRSRTTGPAAPCSIKKKKKGGGLAGAVGRAVPPTVRAIWMRLARGRERAWRGHAGASTSPDPRQRRRKSRTASTRRWSSAPRAGPAWRRSRSRASDRRRAGPAHLGDPRSPGPRHESSTSRSRGVSVSGRRGGAPSICETTSGQDNPLRPPAARPPRTRRSRPPGP